MLERDITKNGKRGCLIIGPPCIEAGEAAKLHMWWDYDLVAKRALGLIAIDDLWPHAWDAVITACMGALAVSRGVYIATPDISLLLNHPYIAKQRKMGRVAMYVGKATPRHGASTAAIEQIRRACIAAAAQLSIPTLETITDIEAWNPGTT